MNHLYLCLNSTSTALLSTLSRSSRIKHIRTYISPHAYPFSTPGQYTTWINVYFVNFKKFVNTMFTLDGFENPTPDSFFDLQKDDEGRYLVTDTRTLNSEPSKLKTLDPKHSTQCSTRAQWRRPSKNWKFDRLTRVWNHWRSREKISWGKSEVLEDRTIRMDNFHHYE